MDIISDLYQKYLKATGVTTDSRQIAPGNIFFALKGVNFDGNKFALQALKQGANYAVADDADLPATERLILVDDVLTTLQSLAYHHRAELDIPVIAITGSNGKTTTKELLANILSKQYRLHSTKGNFNNHIGVPLTLLAMPLNTEIAVIEMGANHIGEIHDLCQIASPTHGVITNIGKAHLEGFGSIDGVKTGKSELYNFLAAKKGVVFINRDELYLEYLAQKVGIKVKYQQSQNPDPSISYLETKLIQEKPTIKIAFLSDKRDFLVEAASALFGYYNFQNVQTAVSIGRYFKVPHDKIKVAVEAYKPDNNRSQLLKINGNTFLLDAYNANPTSLRNALNHFAGMPTGKKIAILGDMLELGTHSVDEHSAILKHALGLPIDQIVVVGQAFARATKNLKEVLHFDDVHALKSWFEGQAIKNTQILLKGSRGIKLETLLS